MTIQRIMGGSVACIPFTLSLSFSLFVYTLDISIILYIATYISYVTDKYISIYGDISGWKDFHPYDTTT